MKKVLPSMAGLGAVALLVGGLAGPLLANDKDSDTTAASAPDMQEMMKKMEAQAAPGAEHQWLAALAGEWETEARCYMAGPETEPTVTKGTCQSKMILGGRFLQEEFSGDMMGKSFQGVGLTAYDKFNNKYVSTWIDSMGTGIFVSEGSRDGKVLTLNGKMDDTMTGEKQKPMKLITRVVSPDKHIMEMHDLTMGEKGKVMEITYVRKGSASATELTAR